jgi:hypothetical protein
LQITLAMNINCSMKVTASVEFKGGTAHFAIRSANSGIYHANLLRYEGNTFDTPPNEVTIIRGVRQWTGSCNEDLQIEKLGEVIAEGLPVNE